MNVSPQKWKKKIDPNTAKCDSSLMFPLLVYLHKHGSIYTWQKLPNLFYQRQAHGLAPYNNDSPLIYNTIDKANGNYASVNHFYCTVSQFVTELFVTVNDHVNAVQLKWV